ncbi:MAG: transcription elongation factor GreAB [Verrucomicrobiota bacterium]
MKHDLRDLVGAELRARLRVLETAARDARAAATDPGSKAESKYDTRSLEASYLAAGQAKQIAELTEIAGVLEKFEFRDFPMEEPAGPGALVAVSRDDETTWFLLVPVGGGLTVEWNGREVTLLSPASPMSGELTGKHSGESLTSGARISEIL